MIYLEDFLRPLLLNRFMELRHVDRLHRRRFRSTFSPVNASLPVDLLGQKDSIIGHVDETLQCEFKDGHMKLLGVYPSMLPHY